MCPTARFLSSIFLPTICRQTNRRRRELGELVVTRLDRVTQYAVASRFVTAVSGMLDRPVKPGDDSCMRGAG
jgi:hypothetical protein